MSLWERLLDPAHPGHRLHTWEGDGFVATTWGELAREAERKAGGLREFGVGDGSKVACVLTNSRDVCASILGVWLAGGTVVSLPVPARGMAFDDYGAQLGRICEQVGAELLLTESRFGGGLDLPDGPASAAYESLDADPIEASPPGDDDAALIQYSSGTTGEPHGCVLSSAAIASHLERLGEKIEMDPGRDRGVSWLPLSHDMGLFGALLLGWSTGTELALGTPERFLASARSWVQDCADFGATITVGPTFALKVAARAAAVAGPSGELSLRIWIVGSDHVAWEALDAIGDALGPAGLRREVLTPAYGLAEATLAVTMTEPSGLPQSLLVDPEALLGGEVVEVEGDGGTRIVSSGTALRDTELRIDDGEICIRSPSLARGYFGDSDRSEARFRDGELRSGDFGFLHGEELYVLGRNDDIFIVAGRNVHAGELEALILREPGVRPGSCALVDLAAAGEDRIVCLIEAEAELSDRAGLAGSIRQIAVARAGVHVRETVFVARGALPKTPSGKVQRFRCRELAVAEDDRIVERVRT